MPRKLNCSSLFAMLFMGRKIRAFNSNGARGGLATPAAQDEGLEEAMEEAARLSKLSVEQRFASFPKAVLSRAQVEEEEDEEEPMDVSVLAVPFSVCPVVFFLGDQAIPQSWF